MYHIFFINSSVEGHLGYFLFLAISKKVAMNTVEQVSLWYSRTSFGCMPRGGMEEGSGRRTITNFLRNCQIDFQIGCTQECSSCSMSWPACAITWLFYFSHPDRSFWFTFPWWLRTLNISLTASRLLEISLLRILLSSVPRFLNWVIGV